MPRFCRVLGPCTTSCHGAAAHQGPRAELAFDRIAQAAPEATARPWNTRTSSTRFAAVRNHAAIPTTRFGTWNSYIQGQLGDNEPRRPRNALLAARTGYDVGQRSVTAAGLLVFRGPFLPRFVVARELASHRAVTLVQPARESMRIRARTAPRKQGARGPVWSARAAPSYEPLGTRPFGGPETCCWQRGPARMFGCGGPRMQKGRSRTSSVWNMPT
jgi:hypothetical protein